MVLTDTARSLINTASKALFTTGGIGLDSTAATAADTELFGGGTTIDDCNAVTGWNETADGDAVTLNTTAGQWQESTGCLNLPATYSTGVATWTKTVSTVDLSGTQKIAVWFFIDDVTDLEDTTDTVTLVFGTGGTTNTNNYYFPYNGLSNGWNSLVLTVASPDATGGSGADEADIDTIRINVKITATQLTNQMRMDYWRYYEADTLGITDSNAALVVSNGDYFFKTVHTIDISKSNGLAIVEAGDNNGVSLLSRVVFAAINKGDSTEIQVDKYYYVEQL